MSIGNAPTRIAFTACSAERRRRRDHSTTTRPAAHQRAAFAARTDARVGGSTAAEGHVRGYSASDAEQTVGLMLSRVHGRHHPCLTACARDETGDFGRGVAARILSEGAEELLSADQRNDCADSHAGVEPSTATPSIFARLGSGASADVLLNGLAGAMHRFRAEPRTGRSLGE